MSLAAEVADLLASLDVARAAFDRRLAGRPLAHRRRRDRRARRETADPAADDRPRRRRLPTSGATSPRPVAASWCGCSARNCAPTRPTLGRLVTLEVGKIESEGLGEVQEMIDICDFAVGLSRQLYGLTIASERPDHRLTEQWHPLGPVGVISAFNFPVAVWSWNAALALVCGDSVIWKPSEKAPLTALAVQAIFARAAAEIRRRARRPVDAC